jgi:hypothetical protein
MMEGKFQQSSSSGIVPNLSSKADTSLLCPESITGYFSKALQRQSRETDSSVRDRTPLNYMSASSDGKITSVKLKNDPIYFILSPSQYFSLFSK